MSDDGEQGQFEVKGLIGQGSFGKVFLVEDPKGDKLALKVIRILLRPEKEIQQHIQEVKLLASLHHEHILKYVHGFMQGVDLCILTEYCANGDLTEYLKENAGDLLDERRLIEWIRQVTEALKYLHEMNIIHRDLKSANVFLDDNWDTKLGDFGIARVVESPTDLARTQIGTPLYMSPEAMAGIPYSNKTDIFSLGIMMYEMSKMDDVAPVAMHIMMFKIIHSMPTMPKSYSSGVTDLMSSMMQSDPDKRPSAPEVLAHKIFQTTKKPKPIPARSKSSTGSVDGEYDADDLDMRTLIGTLTQMEGYQGLGTRGGGAARMLATEVTGRRDEQEADPMMQHVTMVLSGMGRGLADKMKGKTIAEKHAEMLKIYCLECLDNDKALFQKACDTVKSDAGEDDIEEALVRVLGHERYGLCGAQLLGYKNFTFLLRT